MFRYVFPENEAQQQSGDAVVIVFPFVNADTFNFESQGSTPLTIKPGETSTSTKGQDTMQVGGPFFLDQDIIQISCKSVKEGAQGVLQAVITDPTNTYMSLFSPGDWIVAWMFDNREKAEALRKKIRNRKWSELNKFDSGLKFVGKLYSPRYTQSVLGNGAISRRVNIMATDFSELATNIYYDPYITTNFNDVEFMVKLTEAIGERQALPRSPGDLLAVFIANFLGKPSGSTASSLRVPSEIFEILGYGAKRDGTFMDLLKCHIGIQTYKDGYLPDSLTSNTVSKTGDQEFSFSAPHPNIQFTPDILIGFISPMVTPFNNIPIWSILKEHSVPVANEMYTTLRLDEEGRIRPHLIARQIPFNTDDFAKTSRLKVTPFRSLPRWVVNGTLMTGLDVGKSNAMRCNYVQVMGTGAFTDPQFMAAIRSQLTPRWDPTDVERNGLFPSIVQVPATFEGDALDTSQKWTDLVTDRMMGSHLKLSGSINLIGISEPICVGDNLEYEGLLYHIESIEHRVQVNPLTGHKSFSSALAISHGVPATGVALPAITVREFETKPQSVEGQPTTRISQSKADQKFTGKKSAVFHSNIPKTTSQEDD